MTNNSPLISVIIPVYNVEKYIKKCALSLINQTYKNCEFLFVNDGTKDNSAEIIKNIKDSRIKIINQENLMIYNNLIHYICVVILILIISIVILKVKEVVNSEITKRKGYKI